MEPERRLIRSPDDAELVACEWLRYFGYMNAMADPGPGPDSGVDVRGDGIVAQVKAEMRSTGRPVVQQIFGIASVEACQAAVFSLGGFTPEAEDWADAAGVALFQFDLQGVPVAINPSAARIADGASDAIEWVRPLTRLERERLMGITAKIEATRTTLDEVAMQADSAAADLQAVQQDELLGQAGTVFDMLQGRRTRQHVGPTGKRQKAEKQLRAAEDEAERISKKLLEYEVQLQQILEPLAQDGVSTESSPELSAILNRGRPD